MSSRGSPSIPDKELTEAAELLKQLRAQRVLVRFHCDADGACAALAMREGFKALGARPKFCAQVGATFEKAQADDDSMSLAEGGVLVLLDFGTNVDSLPALASLGLQRKLFATQNVPLAVIMVDHHPAHPETVAHASVFASPWNCGGDSQTPAGILAAKLAEKMGAKPESVQEFAAVAMHGDRSDFAVPNERHEKLAAVLDLIAGDRRQAHDLNAFAALFSSESELATQWGQVREKLDRLKQEAEPFLNEKRVGNYRVVLANLDKTAKLKDMPAKGKIANALADVFDDGRPFVLLGFGDKLITLRANFAAQQAGFGSNTLVEKLRDEYPTITISAGGHARAASIRLNEPLGSKLKDRALEIIEGKK